MLNVVSAPFVRKDGTSVEFVNPIIQAIIEDDFEAFIQLFSLTQPLPVDIFKGSLLDQLLTYDRPAMLDEYIRRTGEGICIDNIPQYSDSEPADSGSRKEYLGLSVHGKKRKDLARQGDPNAPMKLISNRIPILWSAARNNSTATVRYLASEQPLAAYLFYASSHSDQHAKLVRQIPDLAASLPALLGWTINGLNETVLTAAITNNHMEMVEMLFSIRPDEMRRYLHLR